MIRVWLLFNLVCTKKCITIKGVFFVGNNLRILWCCWKMSSFFPLTNKLKNIKLFPLTNKLLNFFKFVEKLRDRGVENCQIVTLNQLISCRWNAKLLKCHDLLPKIVSGNMAWAWLWDCTMSIPYISIIFFERQKKSLILKLL